MELIAEKRPVSLPAQPPKVERPVVIQDHDLPVLAQQENPRDPLDWESLLADGMQPALALGAERRWQGPR